jgi:hypothetical protein
VIRSSVLASIMVPMRASVSRVSRFSIIYSIQEHWFDSAH